MKQSVELETGPAESDGIMHQKMRAMLAALAKTGNIAASARAVGIARATHYDWLASDPDYRPAVAHALEEAADVLEGVARKRAMVGSDVLLIFLLKSLRPAKFRERYEPAPRPVEIEVVPVATMADLEERIARMPVHVAEWMASPLNARVAGQPGQLEPAVHDRK